MTIEINNKRYQEEESEIESTSKAIGEDGVKMISIILNKIWETEKITTE